MRLLPKDQRTFEMCGNAIIAGLHEHPAGYVHYTRFVPSREVEGGWSFAKSFVD